MGDIISSDGRNIKNIKARVAKGTGIVTKIMSILDNIPFGSHYFEIAVILRNSLLCSSMLCNSESWYNITKAEMNLLETVDVMLLRKILKAPRSTPKEMLFLELGCLPYKELVQKRRLLFLQYILNEDPDSIVLKFLKTQTMNPTKKDWVTTVKKDIEDLDLNVTFEDIKVMKKSSFKNMLKQSIEKKALKDLEEKKSSHSKVSHLQHEYLRMKTYLMPTQVKMSREEKQLIFQLRSRVTQVKMNYRKMHERLECEICELEDETQKHVYECTKLLDMNKNIDKIPTYENIFDGNVMDQLEIAKIFKQNMEMRDSTLKGTK